MAKPKQRGYRRWMPHNIEAIKKKCTYYINNVKQPRLIAMLRNVASKVVNEIDAITSVPNYTGNLRDSHGVGVYVNGSLTSYIPTQTATRSQRSGFHGRTESQIWGTQYLENSLNDATTEFSVGIWIVLFAAVPYAFYINEEHAQAGFFDEIADTIVDDVRKGLKQLKVKNIPNIITYSKI